MSFNCIITQVHVPDYDVQGSLNHLEKLNLVEFGLKHLRAFNNDSYIILSGHGHRPNDESLAQCDHVIWDDELRPLNEHGYVIGMPAQYEYVSRAIDHAITKGFTYCVKTRGDCVVGISSIAAHCDSICKMEQKDMLITQQTGDGRMGDCFMYGEIQLMHRTWDAKNKMFHPDGLINTAHHYSVALGHTERPQNWKEFLRSTCAFRDVHKLKFTCLRWAYRQLDCLSDNIKNQMMQPTFDFAKYHWGSTVGRHSFDANDNMTCPDPGMWSAKDFYA